MKNHFSLGWGYDHIEKKSKYLPNTKSSIVDYLNQKEGKPTKRKVFPKKDHELFYENSLKDKLVLPKLTYNLPPN